MRLAVCRGKPKPGATLFKQRFQHEPPSRLRLFLTSEIQETVFLKNRPEFLLRLRRAFDHRDLQLEYEIKEEQQSAAERLYTSSDKFQYLLQKHPALGDFKRRFGLETDF
ncbi:hypothetical protein A3SI_13527 [Nitritalea halalkaliphila LW7]|uniref:DNA polymerase III subunit gamma/tau n=1 Tax=Nitritalea halalkaliphila LW7 TaxID=1189621 RepID=I5C0S0_9BACT|nr:hypothetical protein [Nitritalea halalkaliphila]EIM75422.1 hypothetical protein A3SI_13527 [Nitritalea halalkaliphila LW7]